MRLKREAGETGPPTWPAELLQALARYVFQSGQSYLVIKCDSLILFKIFRSNLSFLKPFRVVY